MYRQKCAGFRDGWCWVMNSCNLSANITMHEIVLSARYISVRLLMVGMTFWKSYRFGGHSYGPRPAVECTELPNRMPVKVRLLSSSNYRTILDLMTFLQCIGSERRVCCLSYIRMICNLQKLDTHIDVQVPRNSPWFPPKRWDENTPGYVDMWKQNAN